MGNGKPPEVDLRALALSALAASPLLAWNAVDAWSGATLFRWPAAQNATDQFQLLISLLTSAFGYVFVALGCALYLQRRAPRLQQVRFVSTALAIAGVLVAVNAVADGLALLALEVQTSGWTSEDLTIYKQRSLVAFFLNGSELLAVVAVATQLYSVWRREPCDPKDGARLGALAVVGLALAFAYAIEWIWSSIITAGSALLSLPYMVLSVMQALTLNVIDGLGSVLLAGAAAIAIVRRADAENSLVSVTAAALSAALAYWLAIQSSWLARALPFIFDPATQWDYPPLPALLTAIAAGLIGGPFYLYTVHRDAWRAWVAKLPSSFTELRQWPYRPSADD